MNKIQVFFGKFNQSRTLSRLFEMLGKRLFFVLIIISFMFQAAWMAISTVYPMIFDEYYHFGLIKIYSQQLLPFINTQPPGVLVYGDVTRYGSYLFHYLMSFPYRFIEIFTHDMAQQIIALRFINIVFFVLALFVFRAILKRANISPVAINLSILCFTLIPITSYLSANINYDNLLILGFTFFAYFGQSIIFGISKNKLKFCDGMSFLIIGLLSTLVKSSFLPIFIAGVLFIIYLVAKNRSKIKFARVIHQSSALCRIILCVTFAISLGLFVERYVVNTIVYRSPTPDCQKVLSIGACSSDHPWIRNYVREQKVKNMGTSDLVGPVDYFVDPWLVSMVSGNNLSAANSKDGVPQNIGRKLPIIEDAIWLLFIVVGIVLIIKFRQMLASIHVRFMLTCVASYFIALFYMNYSQYIHLHTPAGIGSRYFLLFIPYFIAIGFNYTANIVKNKLVLLILGILLIAMMTQGGGFSSYIINSNSTWFWDNQRVVESNSVMKRIINPLVKENI